MRARILHGDRVAAEESALTQSTPVRLVVATDRDAVFQLTPSRQVPAEPRCQYHQRR